MSGGLLLSRASVAGTLEAAFKNASRGGRRRNLYTSSSSSCAAKEEKLVGIPYSKLSIGVPKESWSGERRVACSPAVVSALTKKGFKLKVEDGAGAEASFRNDDFAAAGADIVSRKEAFGSNGGSKFPRKNNPDPYISLFSLFSDIVLKLRQPSMEETKLFRDDSILYSFLYPKQNQELIEALGQRKLTAFGMDCVPRISRAQVFDALSSMGNISGYRAVVEASNHFGRFFTGR